MTDSTSKPTSKSKKKTVPKENEKAILTLLSVHKTLTTEEVQLSEGLLRFGICWNLDEISLKTVLEKEKDNVIGLFNQELTQLLEKYYTETWNIFETESSDHVRLIQQLGQLKMLVKLEADTVGTKQLKNRLQNQNEYIKRKLLELFSNYLDNYNANRSKAGVAKKTRALSDAVGCWIKESCREEDREYWTCNTELYASYTKFCDQEGQASKSQSALSQALKSKGFKVGVVAKIGGKTMRGVRGLRLK